jgi:Putative adhesin
MCRLAAAIAAALLAMLALCGCKATVSAGSGAPTPAASALTPQTSAAPAISAASAAAAATPSPSLTIPGTHKSVRTFQVSSPVSALVVATHIGDVTITGSTGATVSVTEQIAYSSTPPVITRSVTGGTLSIGDGCSLQLACGVAYIIAVPSTVTVTATTDTGAIRLSGLAGARVTAKVDVGFIDATGLSVAAASLTTDVGGITATFTTAPRTVTAITKAGAITLHVPTTTSYQITASAVAGKTTISVPQRTGSASTITATTDIGAIQIAPAS